jgi:hypothetical protein
MRYSRLACLALAAGLVLPGLAAAEPTPRVEITGARIGFPGSINRMGNKGRFKSGQWAPLAVDLQVKEAPLKANTYGLLVETTDSDDMQNKYVETRFLPEVDTKEQPTLLTYARVAGGSGEVIVRVVAVNIRGEVGPTLAEKKLTSVDFTPMPGSVYGYLTLGNRVPSLHRALLPRALQNPGAAPAAGFDRIGPDEGDDKLEFEENGNRTFAHLDMVKEMPTHWFGYQATDTVILLTAPQQFVTDLTSGKEGDSIAARRDALAEWVRRGGRLVVSVSKNSQETNQLLEQMQLIDLTTEGRAQEPELTGVEQWVSTGVAFRGLAPPKEKAGAEPVVEIAKLKPGRSARVLAHARNDPKSPPVIVEAPCGLGRVIVVGFDLDEAPFSVWGGRFKFWEKIKDINEPSNVGEAAVVNPVTKWGGTSDDSKELAGRLVTSLEAFPDVPVISFGWVALFILIYILIVGPLDYFFLKKVVKRLELTWITFPAVVIVISAVAYFAAYYLKGNDLRINKVDVVDVDLHRDRVAGNSWFTLFSPRIQNYTIGVEPGTGWGAEEKDPRKYSPFVSWMGRPQDAWMGRGGGSQSLFRRAYDYAPESSGLLGVPIQVWSTKTFSASWDRPIRPDELVEARLEFAKANPNQVSGSITSHLPVELRDAVLFYHGKYYPLNKSLAPSDTLRIDDLGLGLPGRGGEPQNWLAQGFTAAPQQNVQPTRRSGPYYNQEMPQPVGSYIKSILFHAYPGDPGLGTYRNSSLRYLDQRWRLSDTNKDEVILCGRAGPPAGQPATNDADEVSKSGMSASKLWLGDLPGSGRPRARIPGTLSQETYVRVYIPVH